MRWIVAMTGALLWSCAGPAYVAGRRVVPSWPEDVAHSESRLETKDGLHLLTQQWKPTSEPRGVLVLVHGLKDYGDRYGELAVAAVRRGYEVRALDLRGHGDSEGDRVWIDRFEDYLGDVDQFLGVVQRDAGKTPVFLLGHSMGGAIVTRFTETRKPKLAGLITSAGALDTDVPAVKRGAVHFFSVLAPKLALFSLDDSQFSTDPNVVAAMAKDPLIYDAEAPVRTASELLNAIAELRDDAGKIDVPLLCLHGSRDQVTPPLGSEWLVANAGSPDKTFHRFEGFAHDLAHEPGKAEVFAVILDWLDGHAPAKSSN